MAREVLDRQTYPDLRQYPGGPPERPYNAAGWSLPLQMDVRVVAVRALWTAAVRSRMKLLGAAPEPKINPHPSRTGPRERCSAVRQRARAGFDTAPSAAAILPPAGRIRGAGSILVLDPAQNNTFKALNLAWQEGATVQASAGSSGAPIRYTVQGLSESAQDRLVQSLALQAERAVSVPGRAVHRPRIGVYEPWTGSMDAGWTRWVLEQYGFAFSVIRPEDFKSPLAEKIDVLVLADDARMPVAGVPAGRGAAPVPSEYSYRLTADDLSRFEEFVRGGGTIVCAGNASTFAIQHLKVPITNVVAGLRPEEFYLKGSIVQVITDPDHPVMAGMPERAAVFADSSPGVRAPRWIQGHGAREVCRIRIAAAVRVSDRRTASARQSGRDRCPDRQRACSAPGLPPAVARPVVRHVPRPVQCPVVRRPAAAGSPRQPARRTAAEQPRALTPGCSRERTGSMVIVLRHMSVLW